MSNYSLKVKNKETGEILSANAYDDYFGRHKYGYALDRGGNIQLIRNEEEFFSYFERIED